MSGLLLCYWYFYYGLLIDYQVGTDWAAVTKYLSLLSLAANL